MSCDNGKHSRFNMPAPAVTKRLPLIVIAGPTGSGKSALALALAEKFHGEILNFDSLQLYRGLDIGTAKPSREDRNRVPHHLFDVLSIGQGFSAGEFGQLARPVAREIALRGALPVAVGGTGFYLKALLEGLYALDADLITEAGRNRQQLIDLFKREKLNPVEGTSPAYRAIRFSETAVLLC